MCAWVSEPANAWSNLGYLFSGGLIVFFAISAHRRAQPAATSLSRLAAAIVFMGFMSFLYHASNIFPSQWLDFAGMFVMFGVVILHNLDRLSLFSPRQRNVLVVSMMGICCGLIPFLYIAHIQYQILVVVLAVFAFILESMACRRAGLLRSPWLALTMGLFLAAFSASLVDHGRFYCEPSNRVLHGHVLWHVLSACGFACLGMLWRSDTSVRA